MEGIKEILKNYWHILTAIVTAVFIVGIYCMKIEYMSENIFNNSQEIEALKKTVYILVGSIEKEYPGINVYAYAHLATKHNLSTEATLEGFHILKNSTSQAGKLYLMQKYQFTNEQASMVFSQKILDNKHKK